MSSNKKNNKLFPFLSIVIVTKNNIRTLPRLLKNLSEQEYRGDIEIVIVDGCSTDGTIQLIKDSKLKVRLIQGVIPDDPEACKGEGLQIARGEIVGLLDSDNYLSGKRWLEKMVTPLIKHKDIVGSYTWRFGYRRRDNIFNRYFSLIGSADPVGLYLGKADKMSYTTDKWIGAGEVISDKKNYFIVKFNKKNFPTLGSNGFFARKKYLLKGKADIGNFFHIDVPYDILKYNLNTYAVVREVVIHDTAIKLVSYMIKRARYMMLHYQKRSKERRYKVFDPSSKQDIFRIILFIIFSLTFIQPMYISLKGYLKKPDKAWFVHPLFCFAIMISYMYAVLYRLVFK